MACLEKMRAENPLLVSHGLCNMYSNIQDFLLVPMSRYGGDSGLTGLKSRCQQDHNSCSFQLLEASHILCLVVPSSMLKASTMASLLPFFHNHISPRFSSYAHFLHHKVPCDHIRSTQIIQDNLHISGSDN